METFQFTFNVDAPLEAVAAFHHDTRALKRLSPPPMIVQLHRVDPLAEGSISEFTLWLGPLPLRWKAVHTDVDRLRGFTDTQVSGPLGFWKHSHTFQDCGGGVTRVSERILYQHHPGLRGLLSRLLFSRPGLWFLFAYRRWATRRAVEGRRAASRAHS